MIRARSPLVRAAVLAALVICHPAFVAARPAGQVDEARLRDADAQSDHWFTKGRDGGGTHYSPLADIDRANVGSLGLAWSYDAKPRRGRMSRGLEATPIIVDGVLYTSLAWSEVVAIDAATGKELWRHDPQVDGAYDRKTCCDAVNRGVAVWKGRVYVGTLDGFLLALDAKTGKQLWKSDTLIDRDRSYTVTGAPQVAGDVVVIGNGGADFGVRGYITAFDLKTGAQRWRFFAVPGDPRKGFEHPELETAAKTWDPDSAWDAGGGGTAWDALAYDPALDLLYVGTGNASPYPSWLRSPKGGDNLYVASILAIDPRNGRLRWHYQTTPAENWDYTATQPFILADLRLEGRTHKVLMQAPKNGFFYVLDRETGKLLSANNYVYVNWASGVDLATGRPKQTQAGWYEKEPKLVFPSQAGGHNWMPMSYSPRSGLVYIPAIDAPMLFTSGGAFSYRRGEFNMGGGGQFPPVDARYAKDAPHQNVQERLVAWSPADQREVWRAELSGFWNGGVLSTGGDLVFQGTSAGQLVARDATTGKEIKAIDTGTGIMAAPATYRVNGEQYVVVLAGYGGAMQKAFFPGVVARTRVNEARILAFKLGGGPVPLPPLLEPRSLPAQPYAITASSERIAHGGQLFATHCVRCHGGAWGDTPSGYPDLLRMPAETHSAFADIVYEGILSYSGMASFRDVLTRDDVDDIQAYIKSETNTRIAKAALDGN
jgi:quinohemoprotein ethanol dehydrogenase